MSTSSAPEPEQKPNSVLAWLLEPSDPSVRYATLTSLMGRSAADPEVRSAQSSIMSSGLVPELLSLQNKDGSWDDPKRFYTAKYTGTVWTLLLLAELFADPTHPQVRRAGEFILEHSQHQESGGFSCTTSARNGTGLAGGIIPCLTGNMVFSLIRLGFLDDSRVQQGIDWIVRLQRADDGIDQLPQDPAYARYEMCWGRHSCHMGVAKSLKALSVIPADRRTPAVSAKINQLTEYFLLHHLYKKSHNLAEVAKPGWLKPGFPLMYQTDILELLDIFAACNIWDPRLQDALDIITSKRLPDGHWKLENSFNGKMNVRIEQKGKPSKWITLKAMRILRQFNSHLSE